MEVEPRILDMLKLAPVDPEVMVLAQQSIGYVTAGVQTRGCGIGRSARDSTGHLIGAGVRIGDLTGLEVRLSGAFNIRDRFAGSNLTPRNLRAPNALQGI
ncbi:hypothetical protein NDU88_002987 [Pleurodeles waltl]|uniref:Uncharacterized protein n=1 Tax=Pleurodeles waltl TaxID=8319 RepID=A0AAV7Q7P3_PLEWA|nr:hypothetical protein NDU88_002987 [Pleurodeles waltl]